MLFLSQCINGLQLGSIYALVALGYSMVYGIIRLLNFAHGDVIMIGAYIALLTIGAGVNPALAVVLTILGCVFISVLIERVAYRPLRSAPRISLLITAIGISLLLQNLAQLLFSANTRPYPGAAIIPTKALRLGALSLSLSTIVTILVSVGAMTALHLLIQKTRIGKAMRAVSEDTGAAQLMGIDINKVISVTFAIGAALAGMGSVLFCCRYPIVNPNIGSMLGLKAFVAAVLGGIGSIPGAVVGGFAIGFAEVLVTALGFSAWTDAVVFVILIVVLLFKPAGLLGRGVAEKV
ncbi:MAG: branched-chain amino acid ABC transporter permease [Clostridia bacterium]|nr:branched-chain amino acid ABC transporter permease [Clostridia bacterium]